MTTFVMVAGLCTLAPGKGDIPRALGRKKLAGSAELGYLHCGPNEVMNGDVALAHIQVWIRHRQTFDP
jgi:hypothetical protein